MASSLLLLALAAFADDKEVTSIEDGKETRPLESKCKANGNKVELWSGTKDEGYYTRVQVDGDGFQSRINYRKSGGKVTDAETADTTKIPKFKCGARYRFFKVTETCPNGTRYSLGGNYGKIKKWNDFVGPNDCTAKPSAWKACGTLDGFVEADAMLCVKVHYCSDPNCVVETEVNKTTKVSPNQLKYDVSLVGLKSHCGGSSKFGIDVRAALKSNLRGDKPGRIESDTDASGGSCPIVFGWATQAKVNDVPVDINFGSCTACNQAQNNEENEKPEDDEKNNCCSYVLGTSPADPNAVTKIYWDPITSVSVTGGAVSVFSFATLALAFVAALF